MVKINSVLGPNKAEYVLRSAIGREYKLGLNEPISADDWAKIENDIASKYGNLGREEVLGARMMYCLKSRDWAGFGRFYMLYFKMALKRPQFIINNMSWSLFENVSDIEVLNFACDSVMPYAIEEWYQNDAQAYDTYANLLHKVGRTRQAIRWEEKALKISYGTPDEKLFAETLEKMKKSLPTWNANSGHP